MSVRGGGTPPVLPAAPDTAPRCSRAPFELTIRVLRSRALPLFHSGTVTVDGDGDERVFANHTVDYAFGVTDEQLYQHITTAVAVTNSLFDQLREQFPEALEH